MKGLRRLARRVLHVVSAAIPPSDRAALGQYFVPDLRQFSQLRCASEYRRCVREGFPLPSFQEAAARCFSQNGEDGILLLIFAVLGVSSRRLVEMCAGDGIECNGANLIVNHGWEGLLVDGDAGRLDVGRQFYRRCPETSVLPPTLASSWITAENVNSLVGGHGFHGEIDLLSLDLDGMDYWVWRALDVVQPRVVVLEYNNLWGADRSVTVPYREDFRAVHTEIGPDYAGASLSAFAKLGREKGYRLVGCEPKGFNAFFVRRGLGEPNLPEVTVASCLDVPFARFSQRARLPIVQGLDWEEV